MGENINRIFYGDNENQFGDLRLASGSGPHPVAIVIHGGFWRARYGLNNMDKIANDLTSRGIATWNIEYRRVGQEGGGWPGTLLDAAQAADFLHILAETYPLDLNRVITIGHSAGGHLALWLAARHRLPASSILRNDNPLPIHAAISLAGAVNLASMQEVHHILDGRRKGERNNPVFDFLQGTPDQYPQRYAEASPIQLLPIGVKQILIHGTLDINVPIGISHSYKEAAEKAGDPVKMVEIPTAEHFKLTDTSSEEWAIIVKELMNVLQG